MKILHIIFGLTYGGIETMLVNIVNEQIKYANVSIILMNNYYEQTLIDQIDQRIKLIRINRPLGSKNPYYVLKLNYYISHISPNVIHIQSLSIIKWMLPIYRKISVSTIHATPSEIHFAHINHCPQIYAISKSVQKDLYNNGYKSILVENGILTDVIQAKEHISKSEIYKIIQIGRLKHEQKGQDLLIKACSLLVQKGFTHLHIDFIGDGESLKYLKDMVKQMNLQQYITFVGCKDRTFIENHLKEYNLLVQPSRLEGFGLTVAEAMAAKVPVLVSGQEGPMEIINYGEYGFHFINNNPVDLANKIEKIIMMDPYKLEKITNEALRRVQNCYNVKNTAIKYLEEYEIFKNKNICKKK